MMTEQPTPYRIAIQELRGQSRTAMRMPRAKHEPSSQPRPSVRLSLVVSAEASSPSVMMRCSPGAATTGPLFSGMSAPRWRSTFSIAVLSVAVISPA